jgi:hypothetical protein
LGEVPALRLRYTRRASIDLARIVQYLNERSPQGARKVQARSWVFAFLLGEQSSFGDISELSSDRTCGLSALTASAMWPAA